MRRMSIMQSDIRSALHPAATFCNLNPVSLGTRPESRIAVSGPFLRVESQELRLRLRLRSRLSLSVRASSFSSSSIVSETTVEKNPNTKPSICTADELHYVSVANGDWTLALWRYNPPPNAPPRNHPLLLLSGVGANAIGYDLSPGSSFARYMSSQGYDTWILEVRGTGLSTRAEDSKAGLSEASPAIAGQIRDLGQRLVNIIEGQRSVSPQLFDLQERFITTIEDFQKQLDLIVQYDWDFDNYVEEDVPAVMEYIKSQNKPKDGKLLAIGHSMGGILLYAMLSRCGVKRRDSGLTAVVTLSSSLDYTSSKSSLKFLLPLADPVQALNVPVPLGALLAAAYPLSSRPPYVLSWLNPQISAQDMLRPELFKKLVLNNFCTVPAKLLLQLRTAFQEGGLCDRSGTFRYKNHLHKSNVPVLALAGDRDLICPPEAVYETVKVIPQRLVAYKIFGEPHGAHYAHYDLVGGRLAAGQVYPCIIEFINRHDWA
ncbi:hypothetical protein NE237_007310 [Protea cynaroides]|uniref:AB hydrolase-1 domain-containing protein n=1 Tax=Protea cynaroides TaxID=273540 RepID=A0A9Q0KQ04_9MAGN|nr:hypothetical protein NE237_007310 [Protea cynaroides]